MLKIGIIGAGGIVVHRILPELQHSDILCVESIFDTKVENAKIAAEKFDIPHVDTELEKFLARDISAVYIATPVFCHFEQISAAIRAGKHVLCEKPATLTFSQYEEAVALAQQYHKYLEVGYVMRQHPIHQEIKRIITAGHIGKPISCYLLFCCLYPEESNAWRQIKDMAGGGSLMDMGIHAVDLATYLIPHTPNQVFCWNRNLRYHYEVEDASNLSWTSNDGVFFHVESHFCTPSQVAGSQIRILGTEGSITADGTLGQLSAGNAVLQTLDTAPVQISYSKVQMYQMELEQFAKRIEQNEWTVDPGYAQKMLDYGYQSAQNCAAIRV